MAKLKSGTRIYGAAQIDGNLAVGANVTVSGHIVPTANVSYDLGSPTLRFRDGYFSGNTIYIGRETMSVDPNGTWTFTSNGTSLSLGQTEEFNPPNANISGNVTATNYLFGNGLNLMDMIDSEFGNVWANAATQHTTLGLKSNIANPTFTGNVVINSTSALQLPSGLSSERPAGSPGQIRFNSETNGFEGYTSSWGAIGGGGGGGGTPGGADTQIQFNDSGTTFAGAASLRYFKANGTIVANAGVESTSTTSGTMRITGGIGVTGNVHAANIYADAFVYANGVSVVTSLDDAVSQLQTNAAVQAGAISDLYDIKANLASPTFTGLVTAHDLTVDGNLVIAGNLVTANVSTLQVDDSMIYLANDNPTDFLDLGIIGSFTKDSVYQHTGFVRDATDGVWKLFANVVAEPTTTVDFSSASYSTLKAGNVVTVADVLVGANLKLSGALLTSTNQPGTAGQFLTSTGDNIAWIDLDAGPEYTAANTAPALPAVNDIWYDTDTGIIFQYQDDGDTEQWVDISSVALNTNMATVAGLTLSITGNGTVGGTFTSAGTITVNSGNNATAIANGGTNGVGNIGASGSSFNTIFAKATSAQYADLAERYTCDDQYYPGTVLVFGGSAEVTLATESHDPRVAGVVTTHPAYLMNDSIQGVDIALTGRVPCRVLGPVNKGDRLVSSNIPGVAQRLDPEQYVPGCVIGKSLETLETSSVTTIEVAVGRF